MCESSGGTSSVFGIRFDKYTDRVNPDDGSSTQWNIRGKRQPNSIQPSFPSRSSVQILPRRRRFSTEGREENEGVVPTFARSCANRAAEHRLFFVSDSKNTQIVSIRMTARRRNGTSGQNDNQTQSYLRSLRDLLFKSSPDGISTEGREDNEVACQPLLDRVRIERRNSVYSSYPDSKNTQIVLLTVQIFRLRNFF